jgi:hypothetical protein
MSDEQIKSALNPVYPEDKTLINSLCPNELSRFEQWFAALTEENNKRTNTYYSGSPLEDSTGINCWFGYFERGYEPSEALDEDASH